MLPVELMKLVSFKVEASRGKDYNIFSTLISNVGNSQASEDENVTRTSIIIIAIPTEPGR